MKTVLMHMPTGGTNGMIYGKSNSSVVMIISLMGYDGNVNAYPDREHWMV